VKEAAFDAGALACSISGSGPSIFALAEGKKDAAAIAKNMQSVFRKAKIKNTAFVSKVNTKGARKI
jgi:homoserine kinase